MYEVAGRRTRLTAHSIYYLLAAELGTIGVVPFALLIGMTFAANRHTRGRLPQTDDERSSWFIRLSYALDASMVGYLVSGAFITVLLAPYPYLLAALAVALQGIATDRTAGTGPPGGET